MIRFRFGSWQAQEASCLLCHVVEIDQTASFADHVEQVAMLSGCRVGPLARWPLAGVTAFQADEHRAAGRVPDVADLPVIADATSVREIATAHRLGLAREAMCQLRRNLRAAQLLLGHTKLESTVRYLGIEVDDALNMAEQLDL
jgi:hypothetical protein